MKLNPELGDVGSLAGMSGSAAYTFDDRGKPHLVGFLFEAGEEGGVHVPIRIVHASFIRDDGSLGVAESRVESSRWRMLFGA